MSKTERRRLLIITYHFPPDGAVGGLRWAGFSKYLARLGWEVHIVTASPAGNDPVVEHVHRHTRDRRRTINDVYNDVARRLRGGESEAKPRVAAADGPAQSGSVIGPALGSIRIAGKVAMGFPDHARGWILRAGGTARALLDEQRFDAVVSSGPPHSAHISALIATVGREEPLFVDMRDPWLETQGGRLWTWKKGEWIYSLASVLQALVFKKATRVIANTREFANALKRDEPDLPVVFVPNAVDLELLPTRGAERLDGFSIVYLGTLYLDRSFSIVLDGLRSLLRSRPREAAKVTLHIAGHIDEPNLERLHEQLKADGVSDMVRLYGRIPRADALSLLARANLALVLAQNQPRQVPAKLYECVAVGVPTLVLSESDSAAANEARRIGALTLESDDIAGVRSLLDDMVDGKIPDTIPPRVPISYDVLAAQMDCLLRGGKMPGLQ